MSVPRSRTTTIYFDLSSKSIAKAIRQLEAYKKRINRNINALIDQMCSDGWTAAVLNLRHVDTGETVSSIMGYREGDKGIIEVGGNAIWIEFGTGVVKNGTSTSDPYHPNRQELGISDWGKYGEGHGSDPNGWYYVGDDGQIHHTSGIEENPFMAMAAQKLKDDFTKTAAKVFSK